MLTGAELRLIRALSQANAATAVSTLRLSTNKKINSASDDPSGLVALTSLQREQTVTRATLKSVTAASSQVAQGQLALDKIQTQLDTIREKVLADVDQALSADERAANQAAIDDAIAEIDRLAKTDISGRRLLDGSADYQTTGINPSQIRNVTVRDLGFNSSRTISGTVTSAATQAKLVHTEGTGLITNAATFSLSGDRGNATISVAVGESLSTVATRINHESYATGVTATVVGNDLTLQSINYGSAAQNSISLSSGTFATVATAGSDATATINGTAQTGQGNTFTLSDNGFVASVEFTGGYSGAFSAVTVSGEARTFAVSTDLVRHATLALPSVTSVHLGGLSGRLDQLATGGTYAGLNTNASQAMRIIDEAIGQVTRTAGTLDAFATATLDSSSAVLDKIDEKLQTAIDSIDQVNEDEENANLAKSQVLAANAVAGLAILNEQRKNIVALIQSIAGLA